MSVSDLTFDTEKMVAGLSLWVETESPSHSASAVNKVIDLAAYDLASLGASIERIPGRMGYGDTLRATVEPCNTPASTPANTPGIVICCHADTVHEVGSINAMPYRREGNGLWGAGIAAMKSGIYSSLEAMRQIVRNRVPCSLPVTFIFVSDKELGCPSSRELFEATVKNNKYALIPECTDRGGCIIEGRYAQDRYSLDVKVDAVAESGFAESSISEMARHIVAIDELNTEGCYFKVGAINSGQWVNFAEKCTAEVITEAWTEKDQKDGVRKMMSLNSPNPDKGLHVNRGVSLPLWLPEDASTELKDVAIQVGNNLGIKLEATVRGGGSLANITGSLGVPTLDGLGPVGAGARSRAERIEIDSLTARARLMAGLLTTLT